VTISLARVPTSSAPSWTTYDFGIGGGIAFAVLGFSIDEYLDLYVQTTHAVKLNTIIENHIHWTIPSDDTGKNIKFKIDVVAAGIGVDFAVPAGSPYSKEYTLTGVEAARHNYLEIGDIAAFNSTVSSVAVVRLTRVAASTDDYGADVYVLFNDSHVIQDTLGSITETSK
jgi:hypothetical protein